MMTKKQRKYYSKWRIKILFSIIIGYATYYLCRQNFAMIIPAFIDEFSYSRTDIGWILSAISIVYGVGKLINGYISDLSNARYFMSFGLAASAIVTCLLGFSKDLYFFTIFLLLNSWFQSMGWPPAARMLTHWYAKPELGTKWAIGSSSHQIGGAITLIFTGYLVINFGWRYAFLVPSIIAAIVSIFLFNLLRESPKSIGLPSVEIYKGIEETKHNDTLDHLNTIEIFNLVFMNKRIWQIGFANMAVYTIRFGIIFWGPLFLSEYKQFSLSTAGLQIALYEFVGLIGGFSAGWISDKVFNYERGRVGSLFMIFLAISLLIFWQLPIEYNYISALLLVFIGFFVSGPQILIGVASVDFSSKKAVGTASGLTSFMAYLGSSLSGICIGTLVDLFGWNAAMLFFIFFSLIGSYLFFITTRGSKL